MTNSILTQSAVIESLHYDATTGDFFWLNAPSRRLHAGSKAGYVDSRGYVVIKLAGKYRYAHRLAWLVVNGVEPECQIDHIDRDKSNNRICNLRLATASQNGQNKPIFNNNKVGVPNICWLPRKDMWQVYVRVNSKSTYVGCYKTLLDAAAARYSFVKRNHSHWTGV